MWSHSNKIVNNFIGLSCNELNIEFIIHGKVVILRPLQHQHQHKLVTGEYLSI